MKRIMLRRLPSAWRSERPFRMQAAPVSCPKPMSAINLKQGTPSLTLTC